MKKVEYYRLLIDKLEADFNTKNKKTTWGDIWAIQEKVIRKAMVDMREECAKCAKPVDEVLADTIRMIPIP
jgi:hypothetical protein